MCMKRLVSLILIITGVLLVLLLLPLGFWLAIIGVILILLAVALFRSC